MIALKALVIIVVLPLALFLQPCLSVAQLRSAEDVVRLFLQVYGTDRMAEILPYTSPAFRDGLSPEEWLKSTYKTFKDSGYVRLEGIIQFVVIRGNKATVDVVTWVKKKATIVRQVEIYQLRHTNQGWQLLDLRVEDETVAVQPG